ncbi:MAG: DUF333 domain-containing protein [Patescibacteria group bacterium]|nr:DUF333 domain-containing protein [Patescibacteria group bacterium]
MGQRRKRVALAGAVALGMLIITGCSPQTPETNTNQPAATPTVEASATPTVEASATPTVASSATPTPAAGIANPASVYCTEQGGVSKIVTAADGSQSGQCEFEDGRKCDEWTFFRTKVCEE